MVGPVAAAKEPREEDEPWTTLAIGHKSGHLMLITPERVFYAGLLGRPRERCSGAFNIYVAIEGGLWLTTADGRESYGEMVAVPPNVRHTIASDHRSVICLVIEPESVRPGVLEDLATRLRGLRARISHDRIRAAYVATARSGSAATKSPAPNSIRCALARRCRSACSIRAWRARLCRSANSPASR